jgi:thiamine-monophosphate kinase
LGDLRHILKASSTGADIQLGAIDSIASTAVLMPTNGHFSQEFGRQMVLAGGDDYELLFTAPQAQREPVRKAAIAAQVPATRIGSVTTQPELRLLEADGAVLERSFASFDHFKS